MWGGGRHSGGRWEKGVARVMWGPKGPQLGQSSYCSCFSFLAVSEVLLPPGSGVRPPAGVEVELGVGWSARGAEVPHASPETPSSPHTAGVFAGVQVERAAQEEVGARMRCCGCPGAQKVGGGRDFHRHPRGRIW